jgi:hypothetical protein
VKHESINSIFTICAYVLHNIISLKPIHPQLKLHGIDAGVRDGKTGVGNVLVTDVHGQRAPVADEEMKA